MSNNRLLIISILSLTLGGCATTNKEGGAKCNIPHNLFPEDITTKLPDEVIETSQRRQLTKPDPIKQFSGIVSAKKENTNLVLVMSDKTIYEEYSVPVINRLENIRHEPHYGIGLLSIWVPYFWLANPSAMSDGVFGCIDHNIMSDELDLSRIVKTGKSEWRDVNKLHRFQVSGFDKEYEFERTPTSATDEIKIDLSDAIRNTDVSNNTTIKVTCLDCNLLGQEEQIQFKDVKKIVELSADFRDIKSTLVAEEKIKKIEQARLEKEAEVNRIKAENLRRIEQARLEKEAELQRMIKEKENLELKKESLGVPLNDFKIQCKELGFKEGTTDFGNCVLQLNEGK